MKNAETQSAPESIIQTAPVVLLSVDGPIPAEVTRRLAEAMGLYECTEHLPPTTAAVAFA